MTFKTVMYPTPDTHDSNDIRWETEDGRVQGYGYQSKESGDIHIRRCPRCHNENYMSQTVCITCGFSPNPVEKTEPIKAE